MIDPRSCLGRALAGSLAWVAALLCVPAAAADAAAPTEPTSPSKDGLWFDDLAQTSLAELQAAGWQIRSAPGHPGVAGARWGSEAPQLLRDPADPDRHWLRLQARTDGTPEGTAQTQLCHQRRLWRGTTAARIRFNDMPAAGQDGDPVIQTFYSVAPLRHDLDPLFSEVDFEYLPNGGWGSPAQRLYALSWQTVQIEPWQAWNSSHEAPGSLDGWHVLMHQVTDSDVRMYLDGRLLARHAGRHVPVQSMAMSLNLWFSPGGLLPPSPGAPRVWQQDVDWVLHQAGESLSHEQVLARVQGLRAQGTLRHDGLPPATLDSPCNL
ncbi:glycoside hydrolase family 16 protein [Ideonella sp.]|uniref:glycoside hydrolase family 16 protein n=1 Tax=Ideonella sp. TaxID=1929293 RepID=UPI003BB70286